MSNIIPVDRPSPDQQVVNHAQEGLAAADRVLRLEATALNLLADSLNEAFPQALDCIEAIKGRLIITGMGKSGHIARKIAATFASTGTPAQFVHPAEASHGDLGMVTDKDAVLALSNSGETSELSDVINYTKRWHIPLIAITSVADSALGTAGDIVLALPKVAEAGSIALAPTTSTTMMLALGDALAIALLERRGFSAEDFKEFHPGGKLGQRLLRVSNLMHIGGELPLVAETASMSEALLVMTAKTFGCVGAVDPAGNLTGIVTDGDLRRHMGGNLLQMSVAEVMTPHPRSIRPAALAAEALGIMNEKSITSLFVVEGERPIGIIRLHDCLRAGLV
ncbi:MAG TPA: KpsF/GutQ family sugar-phosphate isomerase [Terriglobales bacterium]|nr:KpsF/GutQ family sugar-phosphate isomerase [Terriglobales bacterium]